jgi:peptide/nickel transport system substrate-binding protein
MADDYVTRLFRTASPDNLTGFSDPAVDALLDSAAAALDAEQRMGLLGQAEAAVLALAPIAPIAQFRVLTVQTDAVQGADLTVTGTFPAETADVR